MPASAWLHGYAPAGVGGKGLGAGCSQSLPIQDLIQAITELLRRILRLVLVATPWESPQVGSMPEVPDEGPLLLGCKSKNGASHGGWMKFAMSLAVGCNL